MQHARARAGRGAAVPQHGRYQAVRDTSRRLIEGLSAEDCQVQSMPDASPLKWHLAHTTWFFETFVLAKADSSYQPFDLQFAYLFNSYYNSVGPMHPRPQRGLLTRPSLSRVIAYRKHVDALMERAWDAIDSAGLTDLLELGLNHEQQHQELMLTDLQHALSHNILQPVYCDDLPPHSVAAPLRWQRVDAGIREIGHDGQGFAFDNEGPRHKVWLESFELASRPVTNAEFRDFIDDGGYRNPILWLSDGWAQRCADNWQRPLYWREDNAQAFGLYGVQRLDDDAPVCHISYYEADAYARWTGFRLPTESEWEVAMAERGFEVTTAGDSLRPALRDASGVGQVWEWTSSAYSAYPGFRASPGAVGEYNGKFMCNQFVLRGGSCATPAGHARLTYRNFFPPSARWQFSGLRLARDV